MAYNKDHSLLQWTALAVFLVALLAFGHFVVANVAARNGPIAPRGKSTPRIRSGADAQDVEGIPPPPKSTLQHSASATYPRKEMALYSSSGDMAEVESFYAIEMARRGWVLANREDTPEPERSVLMRFDRGKEWCMILIAASEYGLAVQTFRTESSEMLPLRGAPAPSGNNP